MALEDHVNEIDLARMGSLPKWAATLIRQLAMTVDQRLHDLGDAQAALAAVSGVDTGGQATTWADPHSKTPRPVGVNPDVRHVLEDGDEITVTFTPEGVEVTHTGGRSTALLIQPVVANAVRIGPRPFTPAKGR